MSSASLGDWWRGRKRVTEAEELRHFRVRGRRARGSRRLRPLRRFNETGRTPRSCEGTDESISELIVDGRYSWLDVRSSCVEQVFATVINVGSRPLLWGSFLSFLISTGYSVNLPFLRWKKYEIGAALSIITGRGLILQISTFLHMQTFVLGRQINFSRPLILGTIVVNIFCIVVALFKDVPDIEGDKKFGIRSLAAIVGPKKVFWICVCLLEMVYIFAIVFGATSSRPWSKLITILGHSALGLILWKQTQSIDLKDKFSLQSFYMLIWKLFYAEYMLLPLAR